jgi:hypothetical protein
MCHAKLVTRTNLPLPSLSSCIGEIMGVIRVGFDVADQLLIIFFHFSYTGEK